MFTSRRNNDRFVLRYGPLDDTRAWPDCFRIYRTEDPSRGMREIAFKNTEGLKIRERLWMPNRVEPALIAIRRLSKKGQT